MNQDFMNEVEMLTRQTEDAYSWANKVISSIPQDKWETIPETIETSVTWQVGHLIMSIYYHTIMVIVGHEQEIIQNIALKEYGELFTAGTAKNVVGKTDSQTLEKQLIFMEQKSIDVIRTLSGKDLESELVSTSFPHPIAKTKYEALDWNIKHTMWHCGQLGILKRIVHKRYDFGLKRSR